MIWIQLKLPYIKAHSRSSDTIYIYWLDTNIYLESQRFPNSKFLVLPSLDYSKHPKMVIEFKYDFKNHTPKFVVVKTHL